MVCGLEDLGKESVEEEEEGRSTWPARMEELAQMKNKQVFMELWMGGNLGWGWEVKVL